MQKATHLLQQGDRKLIEIARSVCYESDAAFSKAFRRVVGVTPGEYRHHSACIDIRARRADRPFLSDALRRAIS